MKPETWEVLWINNGAFILVEKAVQSHSNRFKKKTLDDIALRWLKKVNDSSGTPLIIGLFSQAVKSCLGLNIIIGKLNGLIFPSHMYHKSAVFLISKLWNVQEWHGATNSVVDSS